MNAQLDKSFFSLLAVLFATLITSPVSMSAEPWEPEGLEAIWSAGHRSHPEFMNVRRQEYESQTPARTTAEPWMPEGLEAIWSAGHRSHPEFLNIRRQEYENQESSSNVRDSIVTIYDEERVDYHGQQRLLSRSN